MDDDFRKAALDYHRLPRPGKLSVEPTKRMATQRDLGLAYSPGVAAACEEIARDPDAAWEYTTRGNLVAVIMLVFTLPYLQIQLSGGAYLIEVASGGVIPFAWAALLFYVVIIIYVWSGGLRAVRQRATGARPRCVGHLVQQRLVAFLNIGLAGANGRPATLLPDSKIVVYQNCPQIFSYYRT